MEFEMKKPMKCWVLIPARGGSVGIPRKNLRLLLGKPLILYVIETAKKIVPSNRIVVITDDDEISSVASSAGVAVITESIKTPPEETIDQKILRNLDQLKDFGATVDEIIITIQPTSPLLRPESIRQALIQLNRPDVKSVVSVVQDSHLRWVYGPKGNPQPLYLSRQNRQQLMGEYKETGGIIAARLGDISISNTRIIEPVSLLHLDHEEALDIDNYLDLYAAAHLISKSVFAIRVDASKKMGMGHVYRMLALAMELSRHEIIFFIDEKSQLSKNFFTGQPFKVETTKNFQDFCDQLISLKPDVIFLDVLENPEDQMITLRKLLPTSKIVVFEDAGRGAVHADVLVSEFVKNSYVPMQKQITGISHSLLAPSFESRNVEFNVSNSVDVITILFGGTDPSNLALRTLALLEKMNFSHKVIVIRGMGASPIDADRNHSYPFDLEIKTDVVDVAGEISNSDLAITSAGRTVIELMEFGIPSICIAQNEKELTHNHANPSNGVLFLGLGSELSDHLFEGALELLINNLPFRKNLAENAWEKAQLRTNSETVSFILERLGMRNTLEINF